MMFIVPTGTINISESVVKEKYIANTPSMPYETPSNDDLYEGIKVLIDYILSQRRQKIAKNMIP